MSIQHNIQHDIQHNIQHDLIPHDITDLIDTSVYTEDNPLGGYCAPIDETTPEIKSELHDNAVALKAEVLSIKNIHALLRIFAQKDFDKLKTTVDYINSPIINFLYDSLFQRECDEKDYKKHWSSISDSLIISACEHADDVQLVKFLITRHDDVREIPNYILAAAYNGRLQIVKFFLTIENPTFYPDMKIALDHASHRGHLDIVKFFVSKGLVANISWENAVNGAVKENQLDIVIYLFENGYKVNKSSPILYIAAANGCLPMVKFLIEKGASLRMCFTRPIQSIMIRRHKEVADYLFANGAVDTWLN